MENHALHESYSTATERETQLDRAQKHLSNEVVRNCVHLLALNTLFAFSLAFAGERLIGPLHDTQGVPIAIKKKLMQFDAKRQEVYAEAEQMYRSMFSVHSHQLEGLTIEEKRDRRIRAFLTSIRRPLTPGEKWYKVGARLHDYFLAGAEKPVFLEIAQQKYFSQLRSRFAEGETEVTDDQRQEFIGENQVISTNDLIIRNSLHMALIAAVAESVGGTQHLVYDYHK